MAWFSGNLARRNFAANEVIVRQADKQRSMFLLPWMRGRGGQSGNALPPSARARSSRLISPSKNGHYWRNRRLQPKTAFSRSPPVHGGDLEGPLRVGT